MGHTYKLMGGDRIGKALKIIEVKVKHNTLLNVGFPEGATEPDGQPTALVAFLNEFGRTVRSKDGDYYQMPRPFFRNMIAKEKGHWGSDLATLLKTEDYDAVKSLNLLGEDIAGALQTSIQALDSPPLAASTIKAKGFSKPLINTSKMIKSVAKWVEEDKETEE